MKRLRRQNGVPRLKAARFLCQNIEALSDLGALFNTDTALSPDDYMFTVTNQIEYKGKAL